MDSILELERVVDDLKMGDLESYKLFNSIFSFYSETGHLKISPMMKPLFLEYFGEKDSSGNLISSEDEVFEKLENQSIVNVYNEFTGQGTLYNSLRSKRPGMAADNTVLRDKLRSIIHESMDNCDFCHPKEKTPEDVFGRIEGKYSITAANIAKYDVYSSLVIFNKHDPLEFDLKEFSDYIETGFRWFERVKSEDPDYRFPFFVWNCLSRAGASQIHGHAQILMTKDRAYAKVESLKKTSQSYKDLTGRSYLDDLFRVHESLGLTYEHRGVKIFASITPIKEKEVFVISPGPPSEVEEAKKAVYNILRCFIDKLGVQSFNLAISNPHLVDGDVDEPYVIQLVDRGNIFKPTADFGGMELFGTTVVADDPCTIVKKLKECF